MRIPGGAGLRPVPFSFGAKAIDVCRHCDTFLYETFSARLIRIDRRPA